MAGPASIPASATRCCRRTATARLADYIKAGWDRADVEDYLAAFQATFNAPTMLPYLRIRGTRRVLVGAGHASSPRPWAGARRRKQALDAAAAAWDEITDRLGREQQRDAQQKAIGYDPGRS